MIQLDEARTKQWIFSQWRLDAPSHCLYFDDKKIALTIKMTDVLLLLIIHNNRPVSKAFIYKSVWPDVVVSEQLIARAISDLRKVLQDNAKSPTFIETVPRVGYRWLQETKELIPVDLSVKFSAQVTSDAHKTHPANEALPSKPRPSTSTSSSRLLSGIITCIILLVGIMFLFTNNIFDNTKTNIAPTKTAQTKLSTPKPLTSAPGIENAPNTSPDGRLLAYTYSAPNTLSSQILLMDKTNKTIVARMPLKEPTTEQFSPRFSPDGNWLAFTQYSKQRSSCQVVVVELNKLNQQKELAPCSSRFLMSLDWGFKQQYIYYTQEIADNQRALAKVNIQDKTVISVSSPSETGTTDYSPRVSFDGKNLIFVRGRLKPNHHSAIFMQAINKGNATPSLKALTTFSPQRNIYGLAWKNNQSIFYINNTSGAQSLRQLNLLNQQDYLIEQGAFHRIDYHQATKTLSYAVHKQGSNLIKLTVDTLPVTVETLINSTRSDNKPRISPDGEKIAFISTRSGNEQLWLTSKNGKNLRQITQLPPSAIREHSWSPSGDKILLDIQQNQATLFYILDINTGVLTQINTDATIMSDMRWSAQTDWLIASCFIHKQWQICRIANTTAKVELITSSGGISPYSPVNSDYVYFTRQQQGLWRIPLLGGTAQVVWKNFPEHAWKNAVLYQQQLYYLTNDHDAQSTLVKRDLISNQETVLYQGKLKWDETSIDISPSGEHLYMSVLTQATDDIYQMSYISDID